MWRRWRTTLLECDRTRSHCNVIFTINTICANTGQRPTTDRDRTSECFSQNLPTGNCIFFVAAEVTRTRGTIMSTKKMTMGLIIGNRGFFPDHLAKTGREEMMRAVESAGMDVVVMSPEQSKYGAVETHDEARRCAELFRQSQDRIDGVIVSLPNFGDERAIADTLRLARLEVPVLIQATPDATSKMTIAHRRDSFCGKMSVCNNLMQYGIPYSLTALHTVSPDSEGFK